MARVDITPRLHGVFSPDPEPVFALRLADDWTLDGWTLTVGGQVFDVREHTVGNLAAALDPIEHNPAVGHINASALMAHNAALSVRTAVLASLADAFGAGLEPAKDAIQPALDQLVLTLAEQEWLDVFGDVFGISRLPGEADAAYSLRLRAEVQRTRCSPASILSNIERLTGERLILREPWREVFTLSRSRPSGLDRLQGAPTYQYHTMQLVARRGVDWPRILPIAEADRPAGTLMLPPATRLWPFWLVADLNVAVGSARWDVRAMEAARGATDATLAVSSRMALTSVGLRGPYDGSGGDGWAGLWDARTWVRAERRLEMWPPRGYVDDVIDFDHRVTPEGDVRITTDGDVRAINDES